MEEDCDIWGEALVFRPLSRRSDEKVDTRLVLGLGPITGHVKENRGCNGEVNGDPKTLTNKQSIN